MASAAPLTKLTYHPLLADRLGNEHQDTLAGVLEKYAGSIVGLHRVPTIDGGSSFVGSRQPPPAKVKLAQYAMAPA